MSASNNGNQNVVIQWRNKKTEPVATDYRWHYYSDARRCDAKCFLKKKAPYSIFFDYRIQPMRKEKV